MGLFNNRIKNDSGKTQVPVWFMRQAGRYHQHYQNIKKNSDFMTMCKDPKLAAKITHGPIDEFNFDAAILFSDLLFPLQQMGLGLEYSPGPKLKHHLNSPDILNKINIIEKAETFYQFQKEACALLRKELKDHVSLLGFVGAPWTLYTYAVDGGHSGSLVNPKKGIYDGRWSGFNELLFDNLLMEMDLQAQGGANGMCLFDTAAGECDYNDYKNHIIPRIKKITREFKRRHPHVKVIYYSKLTHLKYLQAIEDENIDVLGVDWRMDITQALKVLGKDYMVQGNIDPAHLHLPWPILKEKLESFWQNISSQSLDLDRWICGLGHGVLQHTPEENVKMTVEFIHNNFIY